MTRTAMMLLVLLSVNITASVAIADHHLSSERLAASDRPAEDQARDADRRPADVMSFLGVQSSMTVLDFIASGGYYTEVLARWVGAEGEVHAHNPSAVLQMRGGAAERAMAERVRRLTNIKRLDGDLTQLGVTPASFDVAMTALNFHDVYNGAGEAAAVGTLQLLASLIKPDGVIGVIDHVGIAGQENNKLHRIEEAKVREAISKAGLVIDAEADFLHNTTDSHTQGVFAGGLRGKTDRFVYRIKKPG
ncbi:MAG: hypothetical protein QF921_00055 [Pseudomonadales bacterium]|nr:hypothetical protein [Pseudomonadales bacterium]MDP6472533.1 hypothetical protein [Pseudomonadales bacterium]MDP6829014.1 hypothetical protein [Pseudomonadales bacterium]MDP6969909.1 hypothetical protein [Pseudomonadales bacterium]